VVKGLAELCGHLLVGVLSSYCSLNPKAVPRPGGVPRFVQTLILRDRSLV
jgi:hypothetical protein